MDKADFCASLISPSARASDNCYNVSQSKPQLYQAHFEHVPTIDDADHSVEDQITHLLICPETPSYRAYSKLRDVLVYDSPGSATPVSSTSTQSTLSFCEAIISSIAAIPISLNEQQRHPFGRLSMDVLWASLSVPERVSALAMTSALSSTCDNTPRCTFYVCRIAKVCYQS